MAILNLTPDSFFDGGRYTAVEAAVQRAWAVVAEGADHADLVPELPQRNLRARHADSKVREGGRGRAASGGWLEEERRSGAGGTRLSPRNSRGCHR